MGINLGSFLGAIICGFLLQYKGFSWGFGAAGVGMLLGLLVFLRGKHLFGDAGEPKQPQQLAAPIVMGIKQEWAIYLGSLVAVFVCWQLMQTPAVVGGLLGAALLSAVGLVVFYALTKCEPIDRDRMLVCLFLMSYQVIFWSLFEQTASSLSLMTDRNVDRVVMGFEIPAAAFQSINAFFIITLAPLFNFLWLGPCATRLGTVDSNEVCAFACSTWSRLFATGLRRWTRERSNAGCGNLDSAAVSASYHRGTLHLSRWSFHDFTALSTQRGGHDDGLLVSRLRCRQLRLRHNCGR
jgi:dipeptide/tripeptide permease